MAPAPVRGLDTLDKAFRFASARMVKELPIFLRNAARPVERGAETNAAALGAGVEWSQQRLVAKRNLVYIAPLPRSTRIVAKKRPRFGQRLLRRAMIPALEQNRAAVGNSVDELVARIVRQFNRG